METVYACTHVEKMATKFSHHEGADPSNHHCVMSEAMTVTADNLPELVKAIGERLALDIDLVWVPDDQEEGITTLGFNQLERDDGSEPSDTEKADWEKGEFDLWLCDYEFSVELRQVKPIPLSDLNSIKHYT